MSLKTQTLRNEINLKQEILKAEERIDNLEKDLCKTKTPGEIFGTEEWFKVDRIGHKAFSVACKKIRDLHSEKTEQDYQIYIRDLLIKIIKPKLSKRAEKQIKKELEEIEDIPLEIFEGEEK